MEFPDCLCFFTLLFGDTTKGGRDEKMLQRKKDVGGLKERWQGKSERQKEERKKKGGNQVIWANSNITHPILHGNGRERGGEEEWIFSSSDRSKGYGPSSKANFNCLFLFRKSISRLGDKSPFERCPESAQRGITYFLMLISSQHFHDTPASLFN